MGINVSIDRLDALRMIFDLQDHKGEVSLVKMLKIKPEIIRWLVSSEFIEWNEKKTKVCVTENGVNELLSKSWIQ